jgi:hypothetical protein
VLELGIGVGLFARSFLDLFQRRCATAGKDYYRRLCYIAADRSEKMLTDACRHGTFKNHPDSYVLRVPEDARGHARGQAFHARGQAFHARPKRSRPHARVPEDRRFTLGPNDPGPMPEDMPEDRRFTLGPNDPGPVLICLSRARRWRAGHVCWVRRPTLDSAGIERPEARVTRVCTLAREPNWHGAGLTECNSRQLADSAEAVHAGEAE